MATNVSEKDRILRLLDAELNDLDLCEFERVYWALKKKHNGVPDKVVRLEDKGFSVTGMEEDEGMSLSVLARTVHEGLTLNGGVESQLNSITVSGPIYSLEISLPSHDDEITLHHYAGYRSALARVHNWIMANLGYSGDMPTEVPNQSEGAGA
ncbi:MAG: hypothetical protein U0N15_03630 [Bifidobacterium choerinum]